MASLQELTEEILEFREARDWKQFHTPENLAKSIAIEAGELLELFQWGDKYSLKDLEGELADVMIYCLLLAETVEIDPVSIIREKLKLNETRFPVSQVKGTSGRTTRVDRK